MSNGKLEIFGGLLRAVEALSAPRIAAAPSDPSRARAAAAFKPRPIPTPSCCVAKRDATPAVGPRVVPTLRRSGR